MSGLACVRHCEERSSGDVVEDGSEKAQGKVRFLRKVAVLGGEESVLFMYKLVRSYGPGPALGGKFQQVRENVHAAKRYGTRCLCRVIRVY